MAGYAWARLVSAVVSISKIIIYSISTERYLYVPSALFVPNLFFQSMFISCLSWIRSSRP